MGTPHPRSLNGCLLGRNANGFFLGGFATLGSSSGSSSIFGGVIVRCNGKRKEIKRTWNYGYVIRICRIFLVYKTKFNLISFSFYRQTYIANNAGNNQTNSRGNGCVIYDSRVGI